MFKKIETEKHIWDWRWPLIVIVLLLFLAGIQILSVNKPRTSSPETETIKYAVPGSLISGNLVIPSGEFYSSRINLNRRTKLSGVFRTESLRERVAILVLDEVNFENWTRNLDYDAVTQTGYVPGGKIGPALEPGNYFLVIDNRANNSTRSVRADFSLE